MAMMKSDPLYQGQYRIAVDSGRMVKIEELREDGSKVEFRYLSDNYSRQLDAKVFKERFKHPGTSPYYNYATRSWVARNYGDEINAEAEAEVNPKGFVASGGVVFTRTQDNVDPREWQHVGFTGPGGLVLPDDR